MNYYYNLPIDIQNDIEDKVLQEYQEAHSRRMEATFDAIKQGLEDTYNEHDEYLAEITGPNPGLCGDDLFEELLANCEEEEDGGNQLASYWLGDNHFRWLDEFDVVDTDEDAYSNVMKKMEEAIGIKYGEHLDSVHNQDKAKEWILFIKYNIKRREMGDEYY
jgi:hypothetical protein